MHVSVGVRHPIGLRLEKAAEVGLRIEFLISSVFFLLTCWLPFRYLLLTFFLLTCCLPSFCLPVDYLLLRFFLFPSDNLDALEREVLVGHRARLLVQRVRCLDPLDVVAEVPRVAVGGAPRDNGLLIS